MAGQNICQECAIFNLKSQEMGKNKDLYCLSNDIMASVDNTCKIEFLTCIKWRSLVNKHINTVFFISNNITI